jgi:hypothetical protein
MRTTIRVFDLCSGSGCIPLLFWHQFYNFASKANFTVPHLEILGLDASSEALKLAQDNHASLLSQRSNCSPEAMLSLQQMEFIRANVLHQKGSPEDLLDLNTLRQVRFSRLYDTCPQCEATCAFSDRLRYAVLKRRRHEQLHHIEWLGHRDLPRSLSAASLPLHRGISY